MEDLRFAVEDAIRKYAENGIVADQSDAEIQDDVEEVLQRLLERGTIRRLVEEVTVVRRLNYDERDLLADQAQALLNVQKGFMEEVDERAGAVSALREVTRNLNELAARIEQSKGG